jgi:hypothetical protein
MKVDPEEAEVDDLEEEVDDGLDEEEEIDLMNLLCVFLTSLT